jgi:hypothetical protein
LLELEAESGLIKYSINATTIDCGLTAYNHPTIFSNPILTNLGKVHFDFELDLTTVDRKEFLQISPLIGHLQQSQKQRFTGKVYPAIPLKYHEVFMIKIAYFAAHETTVIGEGTYPSIWLGTPRVRNRQFLGYVEQARHNIIERFIDDMLRWLQRERKPETSTTELEPRQSEGIPEQEESSGTSDEIDEGDPMVISKRGSRLVMKKIEVEDKEELARLAEEARIKALNELRSCGHHLHRKSQSPLTGKASAFHERAGKKLPWRRPSFFVRRDETRKEQERVEAAKEHLDYSCGHHYHRKSRSSLTGTLSPLAMEKKKGLRWHRRSFLDKAEQRRIARLYGQPLPINNNTPPIVEFQEPSGFDYGGPDEENDEDANDPSLEVP